MIKVTILASNEYYMDWVMYLMTSIYSHIQMKLVGKVIALEKNLLWRNGQSINRKYKLQRIVKNGFHWWFNYDTNLYGNSLWCKDEELKFGLVFRGTKLGEGQLVCVEVPTVGWRNFLWIQLEESWSCMVFTLASINLSRILLWRWWFELEVDFIQR
jgi:hypothetical protein